MKQKARCETAPGRELLFNSIVVGLFAEGLISNGSIVDSGANLGEWSCLYAAAAPSRTVHAIEPVALNVKHIQCTYTKDFPYIKPRVGALGSAAATFLPPPNILLETRAGSMVTSDNMGRRLNASARAGTFSVLRLDDVFSDETLGFAHLDVEGGELEALRGGAAVMARDRCAAHDARTARTCRQRAQQRTLHTALSRPAAPYVLPDRPILTVELHMHANASFTQELMHFLNVAHYSVHLVDEVCGMRMDCRNLLAFPREQADALRQSSTLRLATASHKLFRVDSDSIAEHAFPVPCKPGGPCCDKGGEMHCCRHFCVAEWVENKYLPSFVKHHGNVDHKLTVPALLFARPQETDAESALLELPGVHATVAP